jgi:hypothetical protein
MHMWTSAALAMFHLIPSWSVVGDRVVIASNPTFLRSAMEQIGSDKPSIRSTAGFKRVASQLPDNPISLKYSDSQLQFNQMMMGLQQFWPMVTMGATQADLKLPPVLPNLSHMGEHMGPSYQYAWFDAQGLHLHYRGTGIEPGVGAAAGAGVGLAVLMPSLMRTREAAKQVQSKAHLLNIGNALLFHTVEHNEFPANLNELVEKAAIDSKMLESPLKPKHFQGPSYIYISGQSLSMDPDNILVYENPEFCRDAVNVLYMDSHVEWQKRDDFLRDLEATCKRLDREMPEIKFQNE